MARHYLVVSDLHLTDIEDHPDGWKAFKSSRFVIDDELTELVRSFISTTPAGESLTLILNGDVFDFDLITSVPADPPWPVSHLERKRGLKATEPKSAWKLEQILVHHPRFVALLAEVVSAGHDVVLLLGNHDRELHFAAVRQVLIDAVERQLGRALPARALTFEPWFYYVRGEIYVEHGHQFDYYNAFKNQLAPTVDSPEGPVLALTMGNVSNRYLTSQIGFFNPHSSDFVLNFFRYIQHWIRHYVRSRRGLVVPWLWGSVLVLAKLLRMKEKLLSVRGPHREQIAELADRFGLPIEAAKQINRLHRRPITNKFYRMVREFWLDRLLIAVLMTGGTVTLALLPVPLWLKLMVPLSSFPLLYLVYEWLAQGENVLSVDKRFPEYGRAIAELLPVRAVIFGHTHRPRLLPLARGVSFVDTGAWAPVTVHGDLQRLVPGLRNYALVSVRGEQTTITLDSWTSASRS